MEKWKVKLPSFIEEWSRETKRQRTEADRFAWMLGTVVVASRTSLKVAAVEDAFAQKDMRRRIVGVAASSNITEQSRGFDETLQGAMNRLANAKAITKKHVSLTECLIVAIENGIVNIGGRWFDFAWVVIEDTMTGKQTQTLSAMVQFPTQDCDATSAANKFATTNVGSLVIARLKTTATDEKAERVKTGNNVGIECAESQGNLSAVCMSQGKSSNSSSSSSGDGGGSRSKTTSPSPEDAMDPHDPHRVLTAGHVTRKQILTQAVLICLGQLESEIN